MKKPSFIPFKKAGLRKSPEDKKHKKSLFCSGESGQALVMVVMSLAVLMGCAALGVDTGRLHYSKVDLQDATDAAAISAANQLPSASTAEAVGRSFATQNGADFDRVTVNTSYNGDPSMVEVICEKTVDHVFGRILGMNSTEITCRAVAKKNSSIWAGDALPFMNLDDNYLVNPKMEVWESTGPGDFESIWKDEREYFSYPAPHFNIKYEDGIAVQKGVDASIKDEIIAIYNHCQSSGETVYVFSVKPSEMYKYTGTNTLNNKQVIPLADLVLLEVTFDKYEFKGGNAASIYLTVVGEYDFNKGDVPANASYAKYGGNATLIQ